MVAIATAAALVAIGVGTILVGGALRSAPHDVGGTDAGLVDPNAPPPLPTPPSTFAGVNWRDAALVFPSTLSASKCPTGAVQLSGGLYVGDGVAVRATLPYGPSGGIRYGDLTGDGRPEAVLTVGCDDGIFRGKDGSQAQLAEDWADAVVVVERRGADLVVLDLVHPLAGNEFDQIRDVVVTGGVLKVGHWPGEFSRMAPPVRTTYRWNGARMDVVGTPPVARSPEGGRVLLPSIVGADGAPVCAGGETAFASDGMNPATATIGTTRYVVNGGAAMSRRLREGASIDLDGDDVLEVVASISCGQNGNERRSIYVLRQEADRYVVVDVPFADSRARGQQPMQDYVTPEDGVLVVRLVGGGQVVLRWDGTTFTNHVGTYRW